MSYKIVIDSCGDLSTEMKSSGVFVSVPIMITLGDDEIRDDETFVQAEFLKKMAESPHTPKSSCPSPEEFLQYYQGDEERIYVVTLSSELSGTYNSAVLAKDLYLEKHGDKSIHIFNSRSACAGESAIGYVVWQSEQAGMPYEQIVETVEDYIKGQHTYFVLENLDVVRKSGRLTGVKSIVASALNIKPVMGSTPEGTIQQLGQGRGINRALKKMVDVIVSDVVNPEGRILAICHCNCFERAEELRQLILEKIKVKGSFIVDTAGVGTMYANAGGIVVAL